MKIQKALYVFIIVLSTINSFAQKLDIINVNLKDFHSAQITDMILSKDESHFFTSDVSGKIIRYSTKDYSYKNTVRAASGIPVQNMRLIVNDSILVFNQKYEFGDAKKDSLIGIRIIDNEVIYKKQISGDFIGNQDNVIIGKSKNQHLYVLEIFDKRFQRITKTFSTNDVKIAAVSNNLFSVALVGESIGEQVDLKLVNTKTAKEDIVLSIPKRHYIVHLFFDSITNDLFVVLVNEENNTVSIHNISEHQNFRTPVFSTDFYFGKDVTVSTSQSDNNYKIILSEKGVLPSNPLIVEKEKDKFSSFTPEYKDGVSHGVYVNHKDEFVFTEPFIIYGDNSSRTSSVRFNVYNNSNKSHKNSYPEGSNKFYSGTFLPNENWMVIGNEVDYDKVLATYKHKIKYYEHGTFNNRFGKLDLSNYLEVKHKVKELATSTFQYDKSNGVHPFYGYKIGNENDYAFYKYDFINDKVSKIANEHPKHRQIIDYNNNQNYLLVSPRVYYNKGHTEPQEFTLIKNNTINNLEGTYKFGKISNNGNYLLTINANNKAEVRTTKELKVVYEKQLTSGSYKLFNIDENGFAISNSFNSIDFNSCNKESVMFDFNSEDNVFESTTTNCVYFNDIANVKDKVAMIVEGFGVLLNNKQLPFLPSEFPDNISFNSDASKLMLSFNNGKISVYDTTSLKEIGVMMHPDEKSHVFIDHEDHYFTNVNPEDYIFATKNNLPISVSEIEQDYYNPEKILAVFGTPNQDYVDALQKAMSIKTNRTQTAVKDIETPEKVLAEGPPDLYVLSVGVSDYQQSDFNLTFADKDALDISKIYGKLDDTTLDHYNTKFHGKVYTLYDKSKIPVASLNNYLGRYDHVGKLQALNIEATIWLENKNNTYFIWDFNLGTTEPIIMPTGVEIDSYSLEKLVFINPDNSGFYVKSKTEEFYSYSFTLKEFKKVKTPFPFVTNETKPISNNRWMSLSNTYNGKFNEASIVIGEINSETPQEAIRFNLDVYSTLSEEGKEVIDTSYISNPLLKAISSNGKHLMYSAYPFENDVFYKNLSDNKSLPVKLNVNEKTDYSAEVYIAEDGLSFSVVSQYSDDYKYRIKTYSISGKLLNTITLLDDENQSLKAFTCFNNKPKWIKDSAPLVAEELFDVNKLLTQNSPHSFKNTFVKHLTNTDANSKTIKEALQNFFRNTKSSDQVIVFLAGHGVLDIDLNYYFAPHDMDFNNVETNGVSLNYIIESLKKSLSKNKLLLMDSCHSGNTLDMEKSEVVIVDDSKDPNKRGSKGKRTTSRSEFKVSDIISTLFEDFLSTSGITIISASSGEDVAYENKKIGNGAFTSAYIALLKNKLKGDDYIIDKSNLDKSINLTDENVEDLLKEVILITNGKQVPDLREVNEKSQLKMW